jgi:predicted metal-dependent enzyme (double-stranded beta helix superfamily)
MPSISPDVGTRLLFENDRVRVWDLQLPPGGATGLHRHTTDFLYVVIGGGTLQTVYADGTSDEPRRMQDGDVRFREVETESVHDAVNCGDTPWRNIVVEFKEPHRSGGAEPAAKERAT